MKNNDKTAGPVSRIMPEIKIQHVGEASDMITQSGKKYQVFIIFDKRNKGLGPIKQFVNFCDEHENFHVFVVTFSVVFTMLATVGLAIYGATFIKVKMNEMETKSELKCKEMEQQMEQQLNNNTIQWHDAVNSR